MLEAVSYFVLFITSVSRNFVSAANEHHEH
jgi:hypothetical protein